MLNGLLLALLIVGATGGPSIGGDLLCIAGGRNQSGILDSLQCLQQICQGGGWIGLPSLPAHNMQFAMIFSSDQTHGLCVLGGWDGQTPGSTTNQMVCLARNNGIFLSVWNTKSAMSTARRSHAAAYFAPLGLIYVVGGLDASSNLLRTWEYYTVTSGGWTPGANMLAYNRVGATLGVFINSTGGPPAPYLCAVGGSGNEPVECFAITGGGGDRTANWLTVNLPNSTRFGHAMDIWINETTPPNPQPTGQELLILGGIDNSTGKCAPPAVLRRCGAWKGVRIPDNESFAVFHTMNFFDNALHLVGGLPILDSSCTVGTTPLGVRVLNKLAINGSFCNPSEQLLPTGVSSLSPDSLPTPRWYHASVVVPASPGPSTTFSPTPKSLVVPPSPPPPTLAPTLVPTKAPSAPTRVPTPRPTRDPTKLGDTPGPTQVGTESPTKVGTTRNPTFVPTQTTLGGGPPPDNGGTILAGVGVPLLVFLGIAVFCVWRRKKKKKQNEKNKDHLEGDTSSPTSSSSPSSTSDTSSPPPAASASAAPSAAKSEPQNTSPPSREPSVVPLVTRASSDPGLVTPTAAPVPLAKQISTTDTGSTSASISRAPTGLGTSAPGILRVETSTDNAIDVSASPSQRSRPAFETEVGKFLMRHQLGAYCEAAFKKNFVKIQELPSTQPDLCAKLGMKEGEANRVLRALAQTSLSSPKAGGAREVNVEEIPYDELKQGDILGKGSFGTVRACIWRGADYAIKTLIKSEGEGVEDFEKEIRINRLLVPHPHTCVVRMIGLTPAPKGIIMELYPLGSLEDYLILRSNLLGADDFPKIISILINASAGIIHLHAQNIIHQDIAARNFLVKEDFSTAVCDFGLSRVLPPGEKRGLRTESERMRESLPITTSAPETLSEGRYSSQSDVFMFGSFIWEILARQRPFADSPELKERKFPVFVNKVVLEGLRPPVPPSWPDKIKELLTRCWAQHPNQRPTMLEINSILRSYSDDLQVKPEPLPARVGGELPKKDDGIYLSPTFYEKPADFSAIYASV